MQTKSKLGELLEEYRERKRALQTWYRVEKARVIEELKQEHLRQILEECREGKLYMDRRAYPAGTLLVEFTNPMMWPFTKKPTGRVGIVELITKANVPRQKTPLQIGQMGIRVLDALLRPSRTWVHPRSYYRWWPEEPKEGEAGPSEVDPAMAE